MNLELSDQVGPELARRVPARHLSLAARSAEANPSREASVPSTHQPKPACAYLCTLLHISLQAAMSLSNRPADVAEPGRVGTGPGGGLPGSCDQAMPGWGERAHAMNT